MLASRLLRAQIELQTHRQWLQIFVSNGRAWQSLFSQRHQHLRHASVASRPRIRKHRGSSASDRPYDPQSEPFPAVRGLDNATPKHLAARQSLHNAIREYEIRDVVQIYKSLPEAFDISPAELHNLAQCVHEGLRRENRKKPMERKRQDAEEIVDFAKLLTHHISTHKLPANRMANMHLLSLLRESGTRDAALEFWAWLEKQEDEYLHHDVYAAAIELLAVTGAPLAEMEALYSTALNRFPGNFLAYHLSPDAILPDREAQTSLKGIPSTLLQAIAMARLLRGDAKNAYLALDTVFRLYPVAVPLRFFPLFVEERPLSESFTVFAMACRAGFGINVGLFRRIMTLIRTSSDLSSSPIHIASLRAMVTALYLQLGAGLPVPSNSLNEFIIAVTQVLRLPGIDQLEQSQRRQVVDLVLKISTKTFEIFARYGVMPGLSSFNSIITNVAGYGQAPDIVDIVLADMKTLGLEPNDITRRSILSVGGLIKDANYVENAWTALVESKNAAEQQLDGSDFHVLVRATRQAGNVESARAIFEDVKHDIDSEHHEGIRQHLDRIDPDAEHESKASAVQFEELLRGAEKLQADLITLDHETRDQPVVQDFSQQRLQMNMVPPPDGSIELPDTQLRALYDQMTSERSSSGSSAPPPTPPPSSLTDSSAIPPTSTTNLTLAQLRYLNWKSINFLLALAEKHDEAHEAKVDEAISQGVKPPKRIKGLTSEEWAVCQMGLSEPKAEDVEGDDTWDAERVRRGVEEIKRLRKVAVAV